jgi:hypothetical protein
MPTRRDALRQMALTGAAAVSAPLWVEHLLAISDQHAAHRAAAGAAPAAPWTPKVLDAHQNELVSRVAELIIPPTDTPGATDVHVARYIDDVLADAKPEDRDAFLEGLAWLDVRSGQRFERQFVNATPDQQVEMLKALDAAASLLPWSASPFRPATSGPELVGAAPGTAASIPAPAAVPPEDKPGVDVFRALKAMTCAGYYSSEPGLTQEIGDPGPVFETEFKGCTHKEHGAKG